VFTHQAANKNAKEYPGLDGVYPPLTMAISSRVKAEIQTWRSTDESDIWQPHNEENKYNAGCQQFVDKFMDESYKIFYKSVL
jgi:hypothetical protein